MEITRPRLAILIVAVLGSTTVYAQAPSPSPKASTLAARGVSAAGGVDTDTRSVRLLVGRSTLVDVGMPISRVSVTSADVADVLVTSSNELLVNGKLPGTISMFVWDKGGAVRRYEVVVQRDLSRLTEQVKELFPKETIEVQSNGKNVVLSGTVSNKDIIEKAVNLAAGYVDKKEEVVALLQIRDGAPSNQVLLRVRFAEVSRSALTELGVGLFTSPTGVKNTIGRVTTEQFPAPGFDELQYAKSGPTSDFGSPVTSASGKFTFSDFLNLFLFNEKYDLGAMVRALQTRGLFQSLAEPNLVAESGKEASFLAGGEFPIPIAQASGGGTTISVQFKEFGIRLNFTPIVTGNRVHLKVRPEVSSLDFNNAVTLQGFRIPALSTRRTETEIELTNGQTFAIAGLLNNTMTSTLSKIPGIGDIPILGLLFKSKAAQKNQTELVVMITPQILANNSEGVTGTMPRLMEPFLPALPQKKSLEPPPPAFQPAPGRTENAPTAIPAPVAAAPAVATPTATVPVDANAAAKTVTALTPNTRTVVSGDTQSAPAASTSSKALKADTSKASERARKQEREQMEAEMRAKAADAKRAAAQAEQERQQQKAEEERQAKLDREQAKRDAEAAKRSAEVAKKQAEKQAELDRKKAEVVKEQQKAIAEAEAKLKAAEAQYEAEAARFQQHQ